MRLPLFFLGISPVGETAQAVEQGVEQLAQETALRNRRLSVSDSDGDGLSRWEKDFHLSSGGELALRRSRIRAALQGEQTLTREHLASLAVSLAGAQAGVVEEDFPHWQVLLTALYEEQMPADITPLREAVERLAPAHLNLLVAAAMSLKAAQSRCLGQFGSAHLHITSEERGNMT